YGIINRFQLANLLWAIWHMSSNFRCQLGFAVNRAPCLTVSKNSLSFRAEQELDKFLCYRFGIGLFNRTYCSKQRKTAFLRIHKLNREACVLQRFNTAA